MVVSLASLRSSLKKAKQKERCLTALFYDSTSVINPLYSILCGRVFYHTHIVV
nr:MAG TPA: hypothetical protein [Caudoviricetes sp.]